MGLKNTPSGSPERHWLPSHRLTKLFDELDFIVLACFSLSMFHSNVNMCRMSEVMIERVLDETSMWPTIEADNSTMENPNRKMWYKDGEMKTRISTAGKM